MSATTHGMAAGIVLGIVFILLGQQFGYLDLTSLTTSIIYLVIAAVIGGVIFGLIGMALGRRYLKTHGDVRLPPPPG